MTTAPPRERDAGWQAGWMIGALPPGPAELWFAVFADDGAFMGAAPARPQPRWLWRDGCLCCDYSPVTVTIRHRGVFSTGLICAVSRSARAYQPLWPVSLGPPGELRPGGTLHVADGIIQIRPDLPGPHG